MQTGNNKSNMYKIVDAVFSIVLSIMAVSSIALGYAYYKQQAHISTLETILNHRQTTIDELLWRDSIATTMLPFADSSGVVSISYRIDETGNPITYQDAINKVDEGSKENVKLKNQLEMEKLKVKMVTDEFEIKFKESGNKVTMSYPSYLKLDSTSHASKF